MNKSQFIEKYGEAAYQRKLEKSREWHNKNKARIRACQDAWYLAHPTYRDDWYLIHPNYRENWKKDNPHYKRDYDRFHSKMFGYVKEDEKELIENYELAKADNFVNWHIHHRKETDEGLSRKELIEMELYYDRPASELIFLTRSDHMKLHQDYRFKKNG